MAITARPPTTALINKTMAQADWDQQANELNLYSQEIFHEWFSTN